MSNIPKQNFWAQIVVNLKNVYKNSTKRLTEDIGKLKNVSNVLYFLFSYFHSFTKKG